MVALGQYVRYKGEILLCLGDGGTQREDRTKLRLLRADQKKVNVLETNVEALPVHCKAFVKHSDGRDYLVTPKDNIISLKTGRVMQWCHNHPIRLAILAAAH